MGKSTLFTVYIYKYMRCDYALYFIRVILCPSMYMAVISYAIYV